MSVVMSFQRRGAISYDSEDQTALYIRMLGAWDIHLGNIRFLTIFLCGLK